jgi:NtrC-family two-component system response regulator AlgB
MADGCLAFFAQQCAKRITGFSQEAMTALHRYAWPGNLRELRNVVERAVILAAGDRIDVVDLPERLGQPLPDCEAANVEIGGRIPLARLEQEHISRVLRQAGTMEEAAGILGINPATLYRKRKRMAL